MVAPSVIAKDASLPPGVTIASGLKKGGIIKPPPVPADEVTLQQKVTRYSGTGLGIIMNPAVLSIISHFPNKCIPRKSEKYVVNGITIVPVPPVEKESKSGAPQTKPKPSTSIQRYAGIFLAILSSMMFSFTGLIVKILNHHHPLTQATWMFVATVIVAIPMNLFKYALEYYFHKDDDEEKQLDPKSGTFKSCPPDNIEPVKGPEVVSSQSEKENGEDIAIPISKDKLQVGLPPLDLVSSNTKNASKREKQASERKRQIKLFLLLLVRACSGCSGMILYFYSLKYLNVGDSLVIVCSSPIFVFIIGYLFLGESCGVIPVLTIVLSMAGVAVITRPPMLTGSETFQTEEIIGAGLAFSSMLCIAITIIMMRFLQNVYHGLINLVFGIFGTFQTATLALAVGVLEFPHNYQDAILMMATGALFFLGQTFLALALQLEMAGPVSLVRTSEVVFAFIWQFIFLKVSPDAFSISGAGLILAGIFLTISRKWIASLPENSTSRKMFNVLLK